MTTDPRCHSAERLVPPPPLPHVSRNALRRVRDVLPIPTECRYCQSRVSLVKNDEIYGRTYGDWPYAYLCRTCNAYVGLHPHTDLPLGILADQDLRLARQRNKAIFLHLVKVSHSTRNEAYAWLADELGIPHMHCHWGWFDDEQCRQAGNICRHALSKLGETV